jgi:hypothetical protein
LSSFRWNEVIFQSFQSGNLKQLDLEFYLKLRLPTTKRMYRFLDKRFYRRHAAGLRPADLGLRAHRLEPPHLADRIEAAARSRLWKSWSGSGSWSRLGRGTILVRQAGLLEDHFHPQLLRGGRAQDPGAQEQSAAQRAHRDAQARGVTGKAAQELVETHPAGRIRTKLEVFDWLLRNEDRRVGKNPAGYLVASIRSDYQAPVDYQTQTPEAKAVRGEAKRLKTDLQRSLQAQRQACDEAQAQRDKARETRLRTAWERLTEAEREAILAVVKAENPGLGRWKNMLEPLCLAVLETRMSEAGAGVGQRLLFPSSES